jgi:hypothetical protein
MPRPSRAHRPPPRSSFRPAPQLLYGRAASSVRLATTISRKPLASSCIYSPWRTDLKFIFTATRLTSQVCTQAASFGLRP